MCSEMHNAISENRAEIIKDKTAASAQRLQVSALQKRINEADRQLGEFLITNNDNLHILNQAIEENKTHAKQ